MRRVLAAIKQFIESLNFRRFNEDKDVDFVHLCVLPRGSRRAEWRSLVRGRGGESERFFMREIGHPVQGNQAMWPELKRCRSAVVVNGDFRKHVSLLPILVGFLEVVARRLQRMCGWYQDVKRLRVDRECSRLSRPGEL